jgi:hypothetical protein
LFIQDILQDIGQNFFSYSCIFFTTVSNVDGILNDCQSACDIDGVGYFLLDLLSAIICAYIFKSSGKSHHIQPKSHQPTQPQPP